ncbi:MAG TPA: enoyl-CoA hydratase-related protein [Candidatus Tumulicola sp.]
MAASTLNVSFDDGIARVALARPDVRNAFNAEMISELAETFARLSAADDVRVVVLSGEGKSFCGGADVGWMRESLDLSFEENAIDAQRMSDMFRAIDNCPAPVIARVHGAALGGGSGLAAVCDVVVAADDALFGFTEVKLGMIPAVISPFVIAKIGPSNARALFLTGERFSAHRAREIGLAHHVVSNEELDPHVEKILSEMRSAGPYAVRAAKQLIRNVLDASYEDSREITSHAIANQRISPEGQEGLRAFLERRKAGFHK